MNPLRWHQLEGFYHVARLGNYSRAAQAFPYPIGQPAVYQQVKGLQEDLGVVLVRQAGPRRTELTPEGRALHAFIAPFFEGLPNVVERIQGCAAAPLVLAADQFLAMEALPPALLRARAAHPEFQLRLEELATPEIVDRVAAGQVDVGLLHATGPLQGLAWEPLGQVGAALLVPARHPLAQLGRAPTEAEIARHPLIVYEARSPGRILTERLFRESGRPLQVAAEVTFSQTMRALVRAGVAPAFVPYLFSGAMNDVVRVPGKPGSLGRLPREPGTVAFDMSSRLRGGALPFGLLYRSGLAESLAFRALADALRQNWR
jgi:DNA-binding transcriptional LysR family regulator